MVFEQVLLDLEDCGYEVQAFVLPAASVNAPHRRDRLWIVAHLKGEGWEIPTRQETDAEGRKNAEPRQKRSSIWDDSESGSESTSDSNRTGSTSSQSKSDEDKQEIIKKQKEFPFSESDRQITSDPLSNGCFNGGDTRKEREQYERGRSSRSITSSSLISRPPADPKGGSEQGELLTGQGKRESGGRDSKVNASDTDSSGQQQGIQENAKGSSEQSNSDSFRQDDTNSSIEGSQRSKIVRGSGGRRKGRDEQPPRFLCPDWEKFPAQSPVCRSDDGLPKQLGSITFSKWRKESLKSLGNSIVPQVVLQIYKTIEAYEKMAAISKKVDKKNTDQTS